MAFHDVWHDPGYAHLRHLLLDHPGAAELVKTASVEDTQPDLPRSAYAWEARSLYPIHSPVHAITSWLYAKTAADVPEFVTDKIAEALAAYEVPAAALERRAEKVASVDVRQCLFPDGTYPVRDAAEVKTAEARLLLQVTKLDVPTRARVFAGLAKAAEFHGVKLTPVSLQLAAKTACDPATLRANLLVRMDATSDPALKEGYAKLAAAVATDRRGLAAPGATVKLAAVIGELDRRAGLTDRYDRSLDDPIRAVHNSHKLAAAGTSIGGRSFSDADFARMPTSFFEDALGRDVLAELAPGGVVDPKLAAIVLDTLPSDLKRSFAKAATAAGF